MWFWLRKWLCPHSNFMVYAQPDRIALRCPDCGYITTGWAVGKRRRA